MKKYIGVKIIDAEPMNLGAYNRFRGWTIPEDEDPNKEGSRVVYEDGYVSWSPAEAFKAYRPCDAMTFGLAVEAMKLGHKVVRNGWNGKGMFVYLVPAASYPALTGVAKSYFGEDCLVPYREYMALKTVQGDVATWVPSGSDALAEDWQIVE